jgi:hypothetical protein
MMRARSFWPALALAVVLALVAVGTIDAKPKKPPHSKPARASVIWTPARLTLTTDAQGAATATATFVSSVALDNVELRIPGGLGRVLKASPATFAHVDANAPQTITLTLAPGAATHSQAGVVQLVAGKHVGGQPLHVQVRVPGDDDGEGEGE